MEFPLPDNELARLEKLSEYQILDTSPEDAFDDLTHLAAQICNVPIALVSIVDSSRQWFKSKVGLEATETCREIAFCNYTICQPDIFIISDALSDRRFSENPLVKSNPRIRFYAGTPLITPEGYTLGSLCVIDHVPRELNPEQISALQALGRQVVTQLELRRNLIELSQATTARERVEETLCRYTVQLQQALDYESKLKRITDKVRDSLDENQILETAVLELASLSQVAYCNASIHSADQQTVIVKAECSSPPHRNHSRPILNPSEFSDIYHQLQDSYSFQFCASLPAFAQHQMEDYVAVLMCPILDDHGVLGDLVLVKDKDLSFSESEIRLVQQVTNQCAIAIRQAWLYEAVQAQVRELEKLNSLKDEFLSTVSHELRTPISNIKVAIQMLDVSLKKAGFPSSPGQPIAKYLEILRSECHREISLINDLLDLARIDSGMEYFVLTDINLRTWLPSISEPFAKRAQSQQQKFQIEIPSELPDLTTDLSSLSRILCELLNNACKYTPPGHTILVEAYITPSGFQISVRNSGTSLSANELKRIFDKFYRIPKNDPWKHGGTGLGLALVKQLVEKLQGSITVTSEQEWTRFLICLPHQVSKGNPESRSTLYQSES
ncbi:MAG: GAF domain-containing sensor histidine kinase [Elainellaceae cyanobacterium]